MATESGKSCAELHACPAQHSSLFHRPCSTPTDASVCTTLAIREDRPSSPPIVCGGDIPQVSMYQGVMPNLPRHNVTRCTVANVHAALGAVRHVQFFFGIVIPNPSDNVGGRVQRGHPCGGRDRSWKRFVNLMVPETVDSYVLSLFPIESTPYPRHGIQIRSLGSSIGRQTMQSRE